MFMLISIIQFLLWCIIGYTLWLKFNWKVIECVGLITIINVSFALIMFLYASMVNFNGGSLSKINSFFYFIHIVEFLAWQLAVVILIKKKELTQRG